MTLPRIMLVLLLLAGAMVLAAGCFGGDNIREQDIHIYKLSGNGDISWTKTLDSGRDDIVTGLLQTPDGNYLITGGQADARCNDWSHRQTIPVLIWLSGSGEVTREIRYDYGIQDGFIALTPESDGSYRAVTQNGGIWNVSPDGTVIAATRINRTEPEPPVKTGPKTPVPCDASPLCTETDDGGYVLIEQIEETRDNGSGLWTRYHAERINYNGTYAWRRDVASFQKKVSVGKSRLEKIIQTSDGGFLLVFENEKVTWC